MLRFLARPIAAAACATTVFGTTSAAAVETLPLDIFFGARSYASADLSRMPLWNDLRRRASSDDGAWTQDLDALRALSAQDQILVINAYFNAATYRTDTADRWGTPSDLMRNGGDCEDFAAAKYFALRRLGFPADALRIAVVRDARARQFHAVLLVSIDGRVLMLDNQTSAVLPVSEVEGYRPLLAMNEDSWQRPYAV